MLNQPTHQVPVLRRDADGRLTALKDDQWIAVKMRPCFPWSLPEQFLSLRDHDNNEIALVEKADDLDAESRTALEAALEEAAFAFTIVDVEKVEKDFELRNWYVTTQAGPRRFTTKLEDWPQQKPDGSFVITDLAGDLYVVRDVAQLPAKAQKILWAYVT